MDVTAGGGAYADQHTGDRPIEPPPHPSQVDVPGPVSWTPRPAVPVFTGRADALGVLESALDARGGAVITQAAYGLGGVGKSELALQYASTHRADYRLAWWITAADPGRLEAGLAALAARLCPLASTTGTTSDAAEWATGWLQVHDSWLLILDNVENPADIGPLLGQLGGGHVIVTTRIDAGWSRTADPVRLDILDLDAAVELLAARTGRRTPQDEAVLAGVATELGCLPLALDQAAAYMTAQRLTPSGYAERLRQHPAEDDVTSSGDDAQPTIARLRDASIAAIEAASPAAATLLTVLAWYAPDEIPRVLLGGDAPREGTDAALALLARYGLISLTEDAVTIHRLTQAAILARAPADARAMALDWLVAILPDDPERNVAGWPLFRMLVAHAEAMSARFPADGRPAGLGSVQNVITIFLYAQGDYARALVTGQSALDIYETALGPDHPRTADPLSTLAAIYRDLGRAADALPLAERALSITESALGPDHPDTADCMGELAHTYWALGRAADALPLEERVLRITELALGPDHRDTAIRLGNLALTYWDLGRAGDALPLAERALRIAESALGPDHPHTAVHLGNLAHVYWALGHAQDALPLEERALRITELALGWDHPETARLLGNLAYTYWDLGRAADALPLEERALRITELALGPDHPETARLLGNLSYTYRALGREADALPLEERATEIRRRARR